MTYWCIAHAAWFVYTAKTHFLWVILPPKHIRSGLADLLLIRMMKNPSLHYNHKPSRSFQQDLREHTKQISLLTSPACWTFSPRAALLQHWINSHPQLEKHIPITEAIRSRSADTEPRQQATGWSQRQAQTKQTSAHATAHIQDLFLTCLSQKMEYNSILCSEIM